MTQSRANIFLKVDNGRSTQLSLFSNPISLIENQFWDVVDIFENLTCIFGVGV